MKNIYFALILFLITSTAISAVPLHGEYQLGGPLSHKGEPKKGKSHLYIIITEKPVKQLYHSLEGKPLMDRCTGYYTKAEGGLICYEATPKVKYFGL